MNNLLANKTKAFVDFAEIHVAKRRGKNKKNNGATKRLAFEQSRHEGLQLGGSSSGRDCVSADLLPARKKSP